MLAFLLTAVMLFAVALSIEEADWVDEMPSLVAAAAGGLVAGWGLLTLPGPPWARHLGGVAAGVTTVGVLVGRALVPADPAHAGAGDRLRELGERTGDWFEALRTGGISADPVVFVLAVTAAAWLIAYLAAWAVGRWHHPWLALGPSGFVLLTNISYLPGQPSRWFVVFLFAAVLLFSHLQVRGRLAAVQREDGRAATRPPFLSLEVLYATWWVGLCLVIAAWLVPAGVGLGPLTDRWEAAVSPVADRADALGRLFVGIDSKRERRIHPFHDALPLEGRIDPTDEVLMYVEAPEPLYVRVATFDTYSRAGWQARFGEPQPTAPFTQELTDVGTAAARAELRRPVTLAVQVVERYQDRRLLAAGEPLAADPPGRLVSGGAPVDLVALEPERRLGAGDAYRTVGAVSAAPVEALLGAAAAPPAWVRERYLQLPADLPVEVGALARSIVGHQPEPYLRARLVEAYLRQEFPVDTEITQAPPRTDAVAHFLFTLRRGYYDYHASAMAVLLRTLDVPARVAIGFALDPAAVDPVSGAFLVTEQQAWTWTEVYIPGFGWIPFNPTPNRPPILPPGDQGEFVRALGGIVTPGEVDPLNPGFADDELFRESPSFDEVEAVLAEQSSGARGPQSRVGLLGAALAVLAAAGGAGAILGTWWWRRPLRGLGPEASRWARILRLGGWAGVRVSPARTPLETAAQLRREARLRSNLAPLARAYTRERYGPGGAARPPVIPLDPGADRDRAVDPEDRYRSARNELLRRALARMLPRRRRAGPAAAPARD